MREEHLCDICKQRKPVITIHGEGQFCAACHNKRMLDMFELGEDAVHAEHLSIVETNGKMHTFHVQHLIFGELVVWEANEIPEGYRIQQNFHITENLQGQVKDFYQRILDTVQTKSLEKQESKHHISNLLYRNGKYYSLRDKGNIQIETDEDDTIGFVVDGEKFSAAEFAKLLGAVPGFTMQYQIHDASDRPLRQNEYLMPVDLSEESLIGELQELINVVSDNWFVSYKDTLVFNHGFIPISDKVDYLYESGKHEEAVSIAEKMIYMLGALETDDDEFPGYEISLLQDVVIRE